MGKILRKHDKRTSKPMYRSERWSNETDRRFTLWQSRIIHGTYMVLIEEASTSVNSHPPNPMKVELVSPSQQVVEQAKSELQVGGKSIKRKNA